MQHMAKYVYHDAGNFLSFDGNRTPLWSIALPPINGEGHMPLFLFLSSDHAKFESI